MSEPTFSIVVPSMGRPDLLAALVRGISENSGDVKGELCVGLDRMVIEPSPESSAVLRDLDGLTTWWSVAGRPGMSAAMNTAISLASGSWIVILADDMIPMPNWLDLRFDGPGQFMSKDRILCFDLLEPRPGSFPPYVPAGDAPATFDRQKAEAAAFYRLLNCDSRAKPGRFFVGACVLHRSKWVPWPEWCDPYSCNDIAWMWETYLAHPDVAWGWMPGNCVYHFQSASVKSFGIRAPKDTAQQFLSHYGLSIQQAYDTIYRRSEELWQRSS